MVIEKTSTTMLVAIIETLWIRIPYNSHRDVPAVAIRNMVRETFFVDFDFQVLTTWGRKVVHERAPAIYPTISLFILLFS
jgi:hypothetical protein